MRYYDFIKIPGSKETFIPVEGDSGGMFECFQGVSAGGTSLFGEDGIGGLIEFELPDSFNEAMSLIDQAWDLFWEWILTVVQPDPEPPDDGTRSLSGGRGLPAVIIAQLPAITAKMTLVKTISGIIITLLATIKGPVSHILRFLAYMRKLNILYYIVEALLEEFFKKTDPPPMGEVIVDVDLQPVIDKLQEVKDTLDLAFLVEPEGQVWQSIFDRALLHDKSDEGYASILKDGLTFVDPKDGNRKGVLERGLLKVVTEQVGEIGAEVLVKSLLELLQVSVDDLGFVDATMNFGNFTCHVSGKAVEHS